ncbi:MAG TPA: NUDIX domain-containing protein [Symbiobacteriaceae bacterium]|nr:NUDIX domain-containing protein [Symbiobacteriaceae bacterium]
MSLRKAWFTLVHVAYDLTMKLNPRKLAAHAVIEDDQGRVLILRSRYADHWALPGGGLDRRENLDSAVIRECREELGTDVALEGLTGMYYHANISAYVAIFRGRLLQGEIKLSHEHSEYRWCDPADLPVRLRQMVDDALRYECQPILRTFG